MERLKRGYIREDGMVFYHYTNAGLEYWLTPEKFEKYKLKERKRNKQRKRKKLIKPTHNKIKQGTTREDGMVFMKYSSTCNNGEYWVTQEKFNQYKKNIKLRQKEDKYKRWNIKSSKNYREKNKEKCSLFKKKYYQKHIEHLKEKRKCYLKNNPYKIRVWSTNRRIRLKQSSVSLNKNQKKIIECFYEQAERLEKTLGVKFHVDHIVPIKMGGLHIPSNLQIMPAKLNQSKGANKIYRWAEKN